MDSIQVKANISIKTEDNENVYYKVDGQRFEADCTLKLVTNTKYIFTLSFQPPIYINSCSIMSSTVRATEIDRDCNNVTYTIHWASDSINTTKRGQRETLMMIINIKDRGSLTLNPQVKFYKTTDDHHYMWGKALTRIDYECHYKEGTSFFEIDKEIYR